MNVSSGSMDLTSLCSSPENCLCWLIILLDIFAIFYLVFVSFYKVTKFVRMIGWIWIGALITADVIIVAIHPCLLTLLCVLFTIMIMTAMLSVVLPNVGVTEASDEREAPPKQKSKAKCGSYVIREIDANRYCFELYDKQDAFLVRSFHCYRTIADVKQAIVVCRESGEIADVEDRTAHWIKEVNHPKFEMFKDGAQYRFKLSLDSISVMFLSDAFNSLPECKKQLDKTIAAVASLAVYICVEKLSESAALQYAGMAVIGALEAPVAAKAEPEVVKAPIAEAPVAAKAEPEAAKAPIKEEPAKEEPAEQSEADLKAEGGAVIISAEEKKTLRECYKELSAKQKAFFNGLCKAAREKADVKEHEYPTQLSYVFFKNNILRIRIRRNMVEAIFLLMDPAFKQLQNSKDAKIKERKTVLRIANDTFYTLALETLEKKYSLLCEQKSEREQQKRAERLEKARQRRLANKNGQSS